MLISQKLEQMSVDYTDARMTVSKFILQQKKNIEKLSTQEIE